MLDAGPVCYTVVEAWARPCDKKSTELDFLDDASREWGGPYI